MKYLYLLFLLLAVFFTWLGYFCYQNEMNFFAGLNWGFSAPGFLFFSLVLFSKRDYL